MATYKLIDPDDTYQDERTFGSLDAYFKDKTDAEVSADIEYGTQLLVPDLGHSMPAYFILNAEYKDGVWNLYDISSVS